MNIGIDIGGSHVGVGLVGSGGKIINKKEVDITEKDSGSNQYSLYSCRYGQRNA